MLHSREESEIFVLGTEKIWNVVNKTAFITDDYLDKLGLSD